MSVIKRLGQVARGKYLEWSSDDDTADAEVERELAELEAAAAAAAAAAGSGPLAPTPAPVSETRDPFDRRRDAIVRAYADGVLDEAERDRKLAALERERFAPPTPKKRSL